MSASVKIMLSYDYCHFEISQGTDQDLSIKEINEMRKEVQRLAIEAVRQYKKAKEMAAKRAELNYELERLTNEVRRIIIEIPESERTAEQKAKIKALEDKKYWDSYKYDYDDDEPF